MSAFDLLRTFGIVCHSPEGTGGNVGDQQLSDVIGTTLQELEVEGEIILTSPGVKPLADRVAAAVLTVVPHTGLSQLELLGLRSLVLHAVSDKRFFDWEMPTLTGFSADEFQRIAEKLPPE